MQCPLLACLQASLANERLGDLLRKCSAGAEQLWSARAPQAPGVRCVSAVTCDLEAAVLALSQDRGVGLESSEVKGKAGQV